MKPDYYKILGVIRTASTIDIKKAYRSLARQYHPDLNPGDSSSEERFKLIAQAYEALKDDERRLEYDRGAAAEAENIRKVRTPHRDDFFGPSSDDLLKDFLKGFYSRQESPGQKGRKGEDLRYNLKITFKEAARGTEKEIQIPVKIQCPQCDGTGIKAGAKMVACSGCRGKGRVKDAKGLFQICPACSGAGAVYTAHCARCKGKKMILSRRLLQVHVPSGIETGTRLQVKGMGMEGKDGGVPGDFFVVIHVDRHPLFERLGLNIFCTVPVPFFKTLRAPTIAIPTLEGIKKVKASPGIQTGKEIKLSGKGICEAATKKRGDLIFRIAVEMPKKLPKKDKKTLTEMEKDFDLKAYPASLKFYKTMNRLYNL